MTVSYSTLFTSPRQHEGLTLLEMLIAVAISAILVTTVTPSISNILTHNRITSDINRLSALAQHARFTAINEQLTVTLCATTDYINCSSEWRNGKMIFIDINSNSKRDEDERLIASADPLHQRNAISGVTDPILFAQEGSSSIRTTITLCPDDQDTTFATALLIALHGRISIAIDSNDDGIKEDLSGDALTCQ